jgi:hypothetical protein
VVEECRNTVREGSLQIRGGSDDVNVSFQLLRPGIFGSGYNRRLI